MTCVKLAICLAGALAISAADLQFDIPQLRTSLQVGDQAVAVSVSGRVAGRGESIGISLDADLTDLQAKILPILAAQLKQDNRCGDRMSVEQATLEPAAPGALLTATVHYEKWGCAKAFGKEMVKRLVGGNATVRARLTPSVDSATDVHIHAEVLPVEADGQLGEILRSGQMGAALQEKIRHTLESDLEKSVNLKASLPPSAQSIASIRSAAFRDAGDRRLALALAGELHVKPEDAAAFAEQLRTVSH